MKRKSSLILSMLFTVITLSASSFVPASYLSNEGETVHGFIEVTKDIFGKPMLQYMQNNVTFINENKETIRLKASEVNTFQFILKDKNYLYKSYVNQLKPKIFWNENDKVFLQVVKSGTLMLLLAYDNIGTGGGYRTDTNSSYGGEVMAKSYYLYKSGEAMVEVHPFTFRKKVGEFLKDCPSISKDISTKKLKVKDIKTIVSMYNKRKCLQPNI